MDLEASMSQSLTVITAQYGAASNAVQIACMLG
jgi:hypothetical protein